MIDLTEENIKLKNFQDGTQKTKCPQCQPPHKMSDNPLSVTIKESGSVVVWNCHHCGFSGSKFEQDRYRYFKEPKQKTYEKPIVNNQSYSDFMYEFFEARGISKSVVKEFKIFTDQDWICFPYYNEKSEVTNIKYRKTNKMFKQTTNSKPSLYNYDNIYRSDTVIFCEGEIDVLSLAEAGFSNGTTLQNGAPKEAKFNDNDARFQALKQNKLLAKKIILFLDNDESGKALHKELLHRFGKDSCWFVETPSGCKDANEVLMKHGKEKLKELINNAKPYPVEGLYTAYDYSKEIQELYDGNYIKPVEIGIQGLDDIYKIMTGTFHTITGIPNHGKSLFLDQILLSLAKTKNWKFAIFSPEHSTQMHIRRLLQMYLQKNFDENFDERMTKEDLEKGLDFINDHFYFIETREAVPSIELILSIAKSAIFKFGVKGLIIDPYNEINATRSSQKREDEHIRDFISLCKRFIRVHECILWVVAHPTKLPKSTDGSYAPPTAYDISGASHWHNQSDAVLTIHRDFEDHTTKVITRKIREQDLYGKIGEKTFFYNYRTKNFELDEKGSSWEDWNE